MVHKPPTKDAQDQARIGSAFAALTGQGGGQASEQQESELLDKLDQSLKEAVGMLEQLRQIQSEESGGQEAQEAGAGSSQDTSEAAPPGPGQ
jgi:hypothetical protein